MTVSDEERRKVGRDKECWVFLTTHGKVVAGVCEGLTKWRIREVTASKTKERGSTEKGAPKW